MAHDQTLHHQLQAVGEHQSDESSDAHGGVFDAAHIGHHHCPLAPVSNTGAADTVQTTDGAPLYSTAVVPLVSLSQAPPLEPPAA